MSIDWCPSPSATFPTNEIVNAVHFVMACGSGNFTQRNLQDDSTPPVHAEDKSFWPSDLMNLNDSEMVKLFDPGQQNKLLESYYQDAQQGNESLESLIDDLDEWSQPQIPLPNGSCSIKVSSLENKGETGVNVADSLEEKISPVSTVLEIKSRTVTTEALEDKKPVIIQVLTGNESRPFVESPVNATMPSDTCPTHHGEKFSGVANNTTAVVIDEAPASKSVPEQLKHNSVGALDIVRNGTVNCVVCPLDLTESPIPQRYPGGSLTPKKCISSTVLQSAVGENISVLEENSNVPAPPFIPAEADVEMKDLITQGNAICEVSQAQEIALSSEKEIAVPWKLSQGNCELKKAGQVVEKVLKDEEIAMKAEDAINATNFVWSHNENNKSHKCDTCSSKFERLTNLKHHISSHSKEQVICCDPCDLVFKCNLDLLSHNVVFHKYCDGYWCDICNKKMYSYPEFQEHMAIHFNQCAFDCGECDAKFKKYSEFCLHMYQHTGEQLFKCSACEHLFRSDVDLHSHESEIHSSSEEANPKTDSDKCQCEICGRLFINLRSLKMHVGHGHTSTYTCETCGKDFSKSRGLMIHRAFIHTYKGQRRNKKRSSLECSLCDKHFSTAAVYIRHLSTYHSKTRQTRQSSLKAKFQIKVSSRSFKAANFICDICFTPFYRAVDLRKHASVKHSEFGSGEVQAHLSSVKEEKVKKEPYVDVSSTVHEPHEANNNTIIAIGVIDSHSGQPKHLRQTGVKLPDFTECVNSTNQHYCSQCSMFFNCATDYIDHKHLCPTPFFDPEFGTIFSTNDGLSSHALDFPNLD